MTTSVGIVGGTGPLGRGLALRFARSSLDIALGSRDPERAERAATAVTEQLDGDVTVTGGKNLEVVDRDVVILAVPFATLDELLPTLRAAIGDRLVVSAVNPLGFDDDGPFTRPVAEGSAAQRIARALPEARVTAAFHTLSSRELAAIGRPMDDDVPVVGDDEAALAQVVALADQIEGCRGVPVGPLRLAATLESITPVLIAVNRRAKAHTGVRFSRLDR